MKDSRLRELVEMALIAALYVAMSFLIPVTTFGIINFRCSEVLMMLPFYNRKYSLSMIVGCFIVNLFSTMKADVIFGTLATAIVCFIIERISQDWLVPIVAATVNGLIVGLELHIYLKYQIGFAIGSVFLGELIIMTIGLILFKFILMKNTKFKKLVLQ